MTRRPDTPENEHDLDKSILQNEPKRPFIFNKRILDGAEGGRAVDGERNGTRFDDSCSFVFIRGQEKQRD